MDNNRILIKCVSIARIFYPAVDWDMLNVLECDSVPLYGDALGLTEWVDCDKCLIYIVTKGKTETEICETMAHELAHFINGELNTKNHSKRPHGKKWFKICAMLQRKLIWEAYYPEDYK